MFRQSRILRSLSVYTDYRWKERQQGPTLAENETCNARFLSTISTTKYIQCWDKYIGLHHNRSHPVQAHHRKEAVFVQSHLRNAVFTLYVYRLPIMWQSCRCAGAPVTKKKKYTLLCALRLSYDKISVTLDQQFVLTFSNHQMVAVFHHPYSLSSQSGKENHV